MPKITIIIPIYNGLDYTKKCLKSIFLLLEQLDFSSKVFSVVVCDDGSTDGSSQWISENYPNIYLLNGTGDLWWSGGINLGIEFALGQLLTDYILWWNNDIIADQSYFKNLIIAIKKHGISSVIGSKVFLAQYENTVWSMGGFFNPYTGLKDMYGRGIKDNESFNYVKECDWLPGMGTIAHRSVYEKIGMVDSKNFPQYHGDSDFTYRAKKAGFKVIVDPSLIIYNDTRNSGIIHERSYSRLWESLFSIKSNYNINKNLIFYRKHAKSIMAYNELRIHYTRYIGGFIKWKVLRVLGVKRKKT